MATNDENGNKNKRPFNVDTCAGRTCAYVCVCVYVYLYAHKCVGGNGMEKFLTKSKNDVKARICKYVN